VPYSRREKLLMINDTEREEWKNRQNKELKPVSAEGVEE